MMKKNEKNKVILGQDDSLEPRQGACDAAPKANSAESLYTVMPDLIGHLSRIHLLSLRGAVGDVASRGVSLRGAAGDVAISCVKALSSRGRAESSDVVISCNKALSFLRLRGASGAQGIFAPARVLFKHLSCRFLFNLIRRSLEFFAFAKVAPAKNRDDLLLFLASPRTRFSKIATSAFRLLAMTMPTFVLATVLAMGNISESWAEMRYEYDDNGNIVKQTYYPCSNGICNKRDEYLYTYDQNGKKSREDYYYSRGVDGELHKEYTIDYSYEISGNTVKEQQHLISEHSTGLSQTIYTYNESGDITREEHYYNCSYGNCIKDNEYIYTYDANGNQTSRRSCSRVAADGSCSSYSSGYDYTYDANGNMTSERFCNQFAADGSCSSYSSGADYTYDSNGNETSYRYCNSVAADGSCSRYSNGYDYTYDYDEFGNIINKYMNGELEETREYSDGYYVKLENKCNQSGNCKACTKWSTLDGTRCVPGYEWLDDKTVAINDDLPEITRDIIGLGSGMPEKILCRGDVAKCKELLRNYPIYSGGGNPYGYGNSGDPYGYGSSDYYPGYSAPYGGEYLNVDLGDYVEPATEANCETSKYYWSGASCNNKSGGINCEENFKQMETWCNRIRYTPADAAKVLKDTDNEIVMTFKVNR